MYYAWTEDIVKTETENKHNRVSIHNKYVCCQLRELMPRLENVTMIYENTKQKWEFKDLNS